MVYLNCKIHLPKSEKNESDCYRGCTSYVQKYSSILKRYYELTIHAIVLYAYDIKRHLRYFQLRLVKLIDIFNYADEKREEGASKKKQKRIVYRWLEFSFFGEGRSSLRDDENDREMDTKY